MQIDLSEIHTFKCVRTKDLQAYFCAKKPCLQDHQLIAGVFDKDGSRASLLHESITYDIIVWIYFVLFSSGRKDCN
jgi:hypothetical protein